MSRAEIKAKISADTSDLVRGFDSGIRKAADFRAKAQGIGKAIGSAFTGAAIISAMRTFAAGQENALRAFQAVGKEADELDKRLENLIEKLEMSGASGRGGINRALLDFRQSIRDTKRELEDLIAQEAIGGPAGIFKAIGDRAELLTSGRATTADEERIDMLTDKLAKLEDGYKRARLRANELRGDVDDKTNADLEKQIAKVVADTIAIKEDAARNMLEFLDAERAAMQEVNKASAEAVRLEKEKATARREAMEAADLAAFGSDSEKRNLLMGFLPKGQDTASQLRRMGANELGSGRITGTKNAEQIAQNVIDRVNAKIGEVVGAVRNITTGVF